MVDSGKLSISMNICDVSRATNADSPNVWGRSLSFVFHQRRGSAVAISTWAATARSWFRPLHPRGIVNGRFFQVQSFPNGQRNGRMWSSAALRSAPVGWQVPPTSRTFQHLNQLADSCRRIICPGRLPEPSTSCRKRPSCLVMSPLSGPRV